MRAVLATALLLLASCGERALKSEGDECFASSECASTLVCDLGADPHVCAQMGTPGDPGPTADADPNAPDADPNAPDADLTHVFDAAPPFDAPPVDAPLPPI
jgi:hypothetical protein